MEDRTVLNVLNRLVRAVNGIAASYLGQKGYNYFHSGLTTMREEQDLKKARAVVDSGRLPHTTEVIDLLRRLIAIYGNIEGSYTAKYGPSSEWEYAVEDAGNLIANMSVIMESEMAVNKNLLHDFLEEAELFLRDNFDYEDLKVEKRDDFPGFCEWLTDMILTQLSPEFFAGDMTSGEQLDFEEAAGKLVNSLIRKKIIPKGRK